MPASRLVDLPEILVIVATHLSPKDLARACRVSKTFFVPFASQLWRRIGREQLCRAKLPFLSKYATYVEELICPQYYALEKPGPGLTRLRTFSPPDVWGKHLGNIVTILQQNQDSLQNLTIEWSHPKVAETIIKTIIECKNLTHLDIKGHWIPSGAVKFFLNHLPRLTHYRHQVFCSENAMDLFKAKYSLQLSFLNPPLATKDQQQQQYDWILLSLQVDTRSFSMQPLLDVVQSSPFLERLVLTDFDWDDNRNQLAGPFKALAHYLREPRRRRDQAAIATLTASMGITTSSTLSSSSSSSGLNFQHLVLESKWVNADDLYYLLTLQKFYSWISSDPDPRQCLIGLRTLHINCSSISMPTSLGIILKSHLRDTLEDLELLDINWRQPMEEGSKMVAEILHTFQRLRSMNVRNVVLLVRHLVLEGGFQSDEEGGEIQQSAVDEIVGDGNQVDPTFKPWASKCLEHLGVWIRGERQNWCPEGVVRTVDDHIHAQDRKPRREGEMYPFYDGIKSMLEGYPGLDQRAIRYLY